MSGRALSSFVVLRTIYGASQLRSVESAKEISGVLGYEAAPLLQGKYKEGSITSRLMVLSISQKTQHIGRVSLVRTPTVCKLVAESPWYSLQVCNTLVGE